MAATQPTHLGQPAARVISISQSAGTPDTYWATDARVGRAADVLGVSTDQARAILEDLAELAGSPQ